jgi:hypothetical protein
MKTKRTKAVLIRLSTDEHRLLVEKAREGGVTVSALLRDHLSRIRIYNHQDKRRWLCTLLSIRNSLASLAYSARMNKPVDAVVTTAYVAAACRHLEQLVHDDPGHACKVL